MKSKLQALLKKLAASAEKIAKINRDAPPADQPGADHRQLLASAAESAVAEFDALKLEVTALVDTFDDEVEAVVAERTPQILASAVSEGTHVPKPDHDLALDNAVETVRAEEQEKAKEEKAAQSVIAERRTAAVEQLGDAAAHLTDEQLSGDDFETVIASVKERAEKLDAINARETHLASLVASSDEEFEAAYEPLKKLVEDARASAKTTRTPGSPSARPVMASGGNTPPASGSGDNSALRSLAGLGDPAK